MSIPGAFLASVYAATLASWFSVQFLMVRVCACFVALIHVWAYRTWPLNRTAQRTILDLQLPTGLWSSGHTPVRKAVNCQDRLSPNTAHSPRRRRGTLTTAAVFAQGYHDIDSLFIAVRTLPWNLDRRAEVQTACAAFLKACATFSEHSSRGGAGLNDVDVVKGVFTDTHALAAPIFAISICAEAFPELVKTARPWTFSGNRAPFI